MIVKHWKSPDFKAFVVEIPIYYTQILFFFGANKQDLLRCAKEVMDDTKYLEFAKEMKEVEVKNGFTMENVEGGSYLLVWMPNDIQTYEEEGSLAHEIFHATYHTLRIKGCCLDNSSEEAYAYLIGYITTHAYIGLAGNGFSDEPKKTKKPKKGQSK